MDLYFLLGNFFSLVAVICLAVSVVKKNKNALIGWQVVDVVFCILSNVFLTSFSAMTTNSVALVRNILAYKNQLNKTITYVLFICCIVVGVFANNRGIIGWFPIIASSSYTIFMHTSKNDQQMRYALISNLLLWLVHDVYICAYPSAFADVVLCCWTVGQAFKNRIRSS